MRYAAKKHPVRPVPPQQWTATAPFISARSTVSQNLRTSDGHLVRLGPETHEGKRTVTCVSVTFNGGKQNRVDQSECRRIADRVAKIYNDAARNPNVKFEMEVIAASASVNTEGDIKISTTP
jgi:hypothetical protein